LAGGGGRRGRLRRRRFLVGRSMVGRLRFGDVAKAGVDGSPPGAVAARTRLRATAEGVRDAAVSATHDARFALHGRGPTIALRAPTFQCDARGCGVPSPLARSGSPRSSSTWLAPSLRAPWR